MHIFQVYLLSFSISIYVLIHGYFCILLEFFKVVLFFIQFFGLVDTASTLLYIFSGVFFFAFKTKPRFVFMA